MTFMAVFRTPALCALLLTMLSTTTWAAPTRVTLLPNKTVLSYPTAVRYSQVMLDAYQASDYPIYQLGTAFIDPSEQNQVEALKQSVLTRLRQLYTPEATHLADQLSRFRYAYMQPLVTDPIKVRVNPKIDPMIDGTYQLRLPTRPNHITLVHPLNPTSIQTKLLPSYDVRDYLDDLAKQTNTRPADTAWLIQADRHVIKATGIQWQSTLYFLSPGATLFIGLDTLNTNKLPDTYRDLNADIARLLAFRLEL